MPIIFFYDLNTDDNDIGLITTSNSNNLSLASQDLAKFYIDKLQKK